MCRGCRITIKGENTVYEYLEWLQTYQETIRKMKGLEATLRKYQDKVDSPKHKKALDTFRRHLIKARRYYANAEKALCEI